MRLPERPSPVLFCRPEPEPRRSDPVSPRPSAEKSTIARGHEQRHQGPAPSRRGKQTPRPSDIGAHWIEDVIEHGRDCRARRGPVVFAPFAPPKARPALAQISTTFLRRADDSIAGPARRPATRGAVTPGRNQADGTPVTSREGDQVAQLGLGAHRRGPPPANCRKKKSGVEGRRRGYGTRPGRRPKETGRIDDPATPGAAEGRTECSQVAGCPRSP